MILKRVGVISSGRILGLLYTAFGLIVGAIVSLVSLFAAALGTALGEGQDNPFGFLFGLGAVVAMPIFYGILGFFAGMISAALYNGVARVSGGLEIELTENPSISSAPR